MQRRLASEVYRRSLLLAIVLLFSTSSLADDLRRVKPEKVGMSSARLERIEVLNQRYVDEGKLAGAMTMVAATGGVCPGGLAMNMGPSCWRRCSTCKSEIGFGMTRLLGFDLLPRSSGSTTSSSTGRSRATRAPIRICRRP